MIRKSAGFALIDVIFVCAIISILCTIALPKMLLARQSAGAASAIGSMRAINSSELTFALTCGNGFYAPDLTSLGTAPPGSREGFISPTLGSGGNSVNHSGYIIQVEGAPFAGAPPSCNGLGPGATSQGFRAGADALEPTNPRFFATNANGQIYEHTSTFFATMPEVGEPATGHVLR
jgi:type II secretory pathway pseudopilin PulG